MKVALVIGGGTIDPLFLASVHSQSNLVICADSGADAAWEAGITPDIIIGDMDSIQKETLEHFTNLGVEIIKDPSPDHLDSELAILKAIELGVDRILLFACMGERIDQSLAGPGLLQPQSFPLSLSAKNGTLFDGEIILIQNQSTIRILPRNYSFIPDGKMGCSLLPLPTATSVTTSGLQFDLHGEDLTYPERMSVSNSPIASDVKIHHLDGTLAMIKRSNDHSLFLQEALRLTGRLEEVEHDRSYFDTITEIYEHGGKTPETNEGKEQRLVFTRQLMDELCPGHGQAKIIHVAGTSGKGSVCSYLHSILTETRKTGLITSPHLYDFNERIQMNREPIPHSTVMRIWNELKPEIRIFEERIGDLLQFQELILLIAFRYFEEQEVEWIVVETGLGGRFDQTRVLSPTLSAITHIDLDHTHILGTTYQEIAMEKAGIIRQGVPVYTIPQHEDAMPVLKTICDERGSDLIVVENQGNSKISLSGTEFSCFGNDFRVSLLGHHQAENGELAVHIASSGLGIAIRTIQKGLGKAFLPGRIERIGRTIIDTAHNPVEINALGDTLRSILPKQRKLVVICGISETKDHHNMVHGIRDMNPDLVIFTKAGYRGTDPQLLADLFFTGTTPLSGEGGGGGGKEASSGKDKTSLFPEAGSRGPIRGLIIEQEPKQAFKLGKQYGSIQRLPTFIVVTGSTFLIDEIFNPDANLRSVNQGT
jgi:dihydrofolate synthase / folylpolyglutamate synthase